MATVNHIKLLTRNEINESLWNKCVIAHAAGLPYALTSYLDACGDWEALVMDDYKLIMPLPYKSVGGSKEYIQPPITQQLGIIGENKTANLCIAMIQKIPFTKMMHLKMNEVMPSIDPEEIKVNERTNYVLNLGTPYSEIRSDYSKSLRKRIKKAKAIYQVEYNNDIESLVDFYKKEMQSKVRLSKSNYVIIKSILHLLIQSKSGKILVAKRKDVHIDAMLFVIDSPYRIINLFGCSNSNGYVNHAMHFLLNDIIESNSGRSKILDFEGSDLPGVGEFYRSFGPERRTYQEIYKDDRSWLDKVVSKLRS